jgi:uncharacterized protein
MIQPVYDSQNCSTDPRGQSPHLSQLPFEPIEEGIFDGSKNHRELAVVEGTLLLEKIYQRLNTTPEKLAAFCEKWQIVELSVFGSILRDDFRFNGDDPSDIDLLYVSSPQARYGFAFFDMKEELEDLLKRKADLVSKSGIQNSRNWLRRKTILESKQVIYVKRSAVDY